MRAAGLLLLVPALASAFVPQLPARLSSASVASRGRSLAMSGGGGEMKVKVVPKKEEWVPVLSATDIAPGDLIPVNSDGLSLLLVADYDGSVYCTAGCSPFMSAPLEDGTLRDGTIVCPQSGSAFDLTTGELVGPWCPFPPLLGPLVLAKLYAARNLAVFPVRSRGSTIEVFIDRNLKAQFESKYWAGLLDAQGKATGDYY